ncbi:MAG: choice-of-anchor J domain-containing protein [Bacteroidia bacterium]|nr:choice-of-anchor J domain-containing protein [Bacteroidia bacterium]
MKNLLLSLVIVFSFSGAAIAQEAHCFTNEMYQQAIRNNPDALRNQQQLEDFTAHYISSHPQEMSVQRTGTVIYIIPVVFHVIHNYGPENISEEQILDAIRIMNEDYSKLNADTIDIIPQFQSIAADCQIEFRLANIDPNGNCTNGIDRIVSPLTYLADDNSKLNPWPNNKYLNIWVVNSLANTGAAAYAYYPGVANPAVDGVISRHNYVGSIGTSSVSGSRTLTHESGHCLNLAHVWGNNNQPGVACGDDNVSDTPITMGWTSCNLQGSICNPPIIENVQNYMEYSFCENMFTLGQKARMHAALNSAISGRNNLWSAANLAATGTDGSPVQVCAPVADFNSFSQLVCAPATIAFNDLSWNGHPTTWSWDFPGGNPSTSTDSAPLVQYTVAGTYDVTLTVGNSAGTNSMTKTGFIRVAGDPIDTIPFFQDFETANSFPGSDGYVINPDNGQTWIRVSNAGYSGTSSIRCNNYSNVAGQVDDWVTPSFDFSNLTQPSISFWVANARRNSTSNDELKVWASSNCGQSWIPRWTKAGAALSTVGVVSTSFIPNQPSHWRQETVSLNSFALKPKVNFKFSNISDRGNNTYIDDINITGTFVSVDEIDDIHLGMALYPNPTSAATTIQFLLSREQDVSLNVNDLTGRLVANISKGELAGGLHEFPLLITTPGIYLVDLVVGGNHHIRKLIVSGN